MAATASSTADIAVVHLQQPTPAPRSDAALLAPHRDGDAGAFGVLVMRHSPTRRMR